MKTPIVMNPKSTGIVSRQGHFHAASKALCGVVLALFALPCLLSAQTLLHRYSFVSDASDSVGTANGTIVSPSGGSSVNINNGLQLAGGGGPGFSGYVTLPSGIMNTTSNITIECWATQNTQNQWAELWNFNNGTGQYFGYIPYPANNGNNMSMAIKNGSESDALSGVKFPNGIQEHVTATFNATNLHGVLYLGPNQIATVTVPNTTYIPGSFNTANNYLGQDPFPDPQFQGTLYEFRIYNGVLNPFQIAVNDVAGPGTLVTSYVPTTASFLTSATNIVLTGTAQATISVTLSATGTSNINATSIATNWVSSNPSVLKVNSSSGVITGVGLGSGTVSATVNGVTATSPTIFVTAAQTLLHRYSFASDASDSVGGPAWNGTIIAPNGGTNATISNGLLLPGGGGPGHSGYLLLPGGILTNTTSVTIECWTLQNNGNTWAQILNFGNIQGQGVGFIPLPGRDNGNLEVGVSANGSEIDTISGIHFPTNSQQYVSFVFDSSALKSGLYNNGNLLATQTFPNATYIPGSIGSTLGATNNVLGQDPFPDPQYQGTIYELRVWNGAMTPVYEEASAAAGPSVVITNTVPTLVNIGLTNTSMVGSGTQQATVTASFVQVSSVTVTGGATNWVSSNPNVLTVNSSGLITGVNGGTATVSATVDGVTASSAIITVASTPPVFTQKPSNATVAVNDNTSFSAAGLGGNLNYQWSFNGNPIAGATNTTLSLTNVGLTNSGTYSILISNNLGTTNVSVTLAVVQAVLLHRYSFVSDASDSVGTANGVIIAPNGGSAATINNGLTLPGGGGGGFSGYVAFPSGMLTNTTSLTVECWVTQNTAQQWATVWDFANNGNQNFEMCPFPQRGILNLDVAITPNGGEIDTVSGGLFPSGTQVYTAFTFNAGTLTGSIYTNGLLGGTQIYPNTTYIPGTIGGANGTSQNWLGNDTFGDSQFQGTIYEFRIWDGAVTPLYLEVSAAAGPGVVVTSLTPTSISVSVTNSTMVQGLSQPASAIGNFSAVSGVNVTGSITNWTSSNTNVLMVSASGQVTAVGTGSATISATLNGTTGTSPSISVPTSPPIITQQPAASDTFLQGATLTATVANIGTPPFIYRWFFNNGATPISTSANPILSIPNVQLAAAGTYTVVVSNVDGSVTSSGLVVSVVAPNQYEQVILQLNPIAYWPLQETSGSIAYDVIGGDNGTYTNFPSVNGSSISLGQSGPSQSFFGNSSSAAGFLSAIVDIPEGQLNITGPITITAWVQQEVTANFGGLVGHGDTSWRTAITQNGAPGDGLAAGNVGGTQSDATAPASANINDFNWHMVVYTYNGNVGQPNNGVLYIDGVEVASNTVTAVPPGNNLDVWIGGAPDYGTQRLLPAANIAHVAIFTQSFTSAQVQGLFNGTFVLGPQLINIARSGPNVVLTWQTGTLLQTTNLLGPWTTNSTATSPYTVPATNKASFYRLQVSP